MRTKVLLTFILLGTSLMVSAQKQAAAVRFLKKAGKKIKKTESISYYAKGFYKNPATPDTIRFSASVKYALNPRDFFYGYDLWIDDGKYLQNLYSLGRIYTIDNKNKKIYSKRLLDPKKIDIEKGPFSKNITVRSFPAFLKNKEFFEQIINNADARIVKISHGFCNDTVEIDVDFNSKNVVIDADTFYDFGYKFLLNRKTAFPFSVSTRGQSNYGSFFSSVNFTRPAIDSSSTLDFFLSYSLPAGYSEIKTDLTKKHSRQKCVKKEKAFDFQAIDTKGNTVTLNNFKGKVVLLDFWYSTCAPCIKASQFLEKYYRQYADSGLIILGMDPMDGRAKIAEHNSKWRITYPGIKCDALVKNKYGVHSFPTFILIDRQGMIVSRWSGFSKSQMERIRQKIEEVLKQE